MVRRWSAGPRNMG